MADAPEVGLADAIRATAARLQVDPADLATAISYETAGSFDPWKKGPTTKWGEHRGLIQWGEPQRQQYGVAQDMPVSAQMDAVGKYLTDAGVKPGHGLLDIYSAINAGRVGLYDRSDAAAGGAPGSVRDKVLGMAPHRVRAQLLLDGRLPGSAAAPAAVAAPAAPVEPAPLGFAPVSGGGSDQSLDDLIAAARRIAAEAQRDPIAALAPLNVNYPISRNLARSRALRRSSL